jgi:hypothetical protein
MFLVGIILGASCLGTNGKAKPDVKPGSRNLLFESMVDNIANPSIYVLGTGSDDHSYTDPIVRFNSASVATQLRAQSGWTDGWMGAGFGTVHTARSTDTPQGRQLPASSACWMRPSMRSVANFSNEIFAVEIFAVYQ